MGKNKKLLYVIIIAVAVIIPVMMEHNIIFKQSKYIYLLLCLIGIYTIVTSGLDIVFGYTGQISFGHAGFFCIGAYGTVLLTHPDWGLGKYLGITIPPIISIVIVSLLAALVGALLAIPASKLVFHFLALLTIAFNQLVLLVVSNFAGLTNGYIGITRVPSINILGFSFNTIKSKYTYYFLVLFFE